MVPTCNAIEDIWVVPLTGLEIKDNQVGELGVAVPATVGVELVVKDED